MWSYLITYFLKTHGEDIETGTQKRSLIFYSQKHYRYENEELKSSAEVERNINVTFFDEGESMMVSIEPSLSAKKAFLISNQNNIFVYKGEDPNYRFTIFIDNFDEIEKFTLELISKKLKAEYY